MPPPYGGGAYQWLRDTAAYSHAILEVSIKIKCSDVRENKNRQPDIQTDTSHVTLTFDLLDQKSIQQQWLVFPKVMYTNFGNPRAAIAAVLLTNLHRE